MIEAVIFDMDGVLLDSEPFWQDAEMEVFATVGIQLTRAQCMESTGIPLSEVVAYRFNQKPWNYKSPEQVAEEILKNVERLVIERAVPLDGVMEVLDYFHSKNIPIALASSSKIQLINTVLKKLALTSTFAVVQSAEWEEYGKPHPAVFITTAKQLRVKPAHCLVFEDSFNGLIAAKAARMKTVVLPIAAQWNETRFDIADLKLKSLAQFSENHWNHLNTLP